MITVFHTSWQLAIPHLLNRYLFFHFLGSGYGTGPVMVGLLLFVLFLDYDNLSQYRDVLVHTKLVRMHMFMVTLSTRLTFLT